MHYEQNARELGAIIIIIMNKSNSTLLNADPKIRHHKDWIHKCQVCDPRMKACKKSSQSTNKLRPKDNASYVNRVHGD